MKEEQKIEAFKFLAETHRKELTSRRAVEWKILFTVLTFYTLATVAGEKIPSNISSLAVWSLSILVAVITVVFLVYIHQANFKSKTFAHNAENHIVAVLEQTNPKKSLLEIGDWAPTSRYEWFKFGSGMWAIAWQTIIIFVFAVMSAISITL